MNTTIIIVKLNGTTMAIVVFRVWFCGELLIDASEMMNDDSNCSKVFKEKLGFNIDVTET